MKVHVENDKVIDDKEKEKIVRNCNGHSASWSRMVNLCAAHPCTDAQGDRLTAALTQDQNMLAPV